MQPGFGRWISVRSTTLASASGLSSVNLDSTTSLKTPSADRLDSTSRTSRANFAREATRALCGLSVVLSALSASLHASDDVVETAVEDESRVLCGELGEFGPGEGRIETGLALPF